MTSKDHRADEPGITRTDTCHDRGVDMDEKSNTDEDVIHSSSSDNEQLPKEFQEGGYGCLPVRDLVPSRVADPSAHQTALLLAPLATVCIRRFGTRRCLQIGVLLETAAFIGASFTTQIWHLILSQGVAFGAGMGFLFTGTVGLLPQWFQKKRSLANSIGSAGSGFGGLAYSLAAHAMIDNLGLAWAFRILAILAFVVNGTCSFLARDRNKEVAAVHQAFHKELFKKVELYLVLAWGFFSILGYIIVVFSLASYASAVGFTSTQGSIVAAIFNLSQGLGRPMIGYFSDKIGRINIAALSSLVAGLAAFFLWIFAGKHFAGAIIYALFGAFAGSIWPCIAPVAAEVVGLQLLPSAMSVTWLVMVLPATFAEVIGLSLVTPGRNGYLDVQAYTGAMFVIAFAFLWALRICQIRTMEVAGLLEKEKVTPNPDAVRAGKHKTSGQQTKSSVAFAVKACFSLVKV
ncbi:putative transporter MCH2 [Cytospora mali]|uniref:Transporter MCH2 n=1 Tax=Cytospora mali TaxID=578113 RepID=A0A194VPJ2_CYTMA|nr:putative transporter MCH2 [Valsa mali]